ncbi:hypothetical protein L3X38_028315 [Prunus dulcis]|uniref:Uncharacterized protein n=1 Tax=Prunus dulcis TaxID=3755 RepID=A0AAD4VQW3_PRUDU|nr:hypothetical protein L3X38_028315 [Prunus dulcis]
MYNKFRATHLGLTLKHMLWAAARATTISWWEAEMEKIKEEDLEAWKWLVQRLPNNWTKSHFHPRYECDLLLNNLCESFNVAIIDAKDNSILTCLESIRMYVMLRMANRSVTSRDRLRHSTILSALGPLSALTVLFLGAHEQLPSRSPILGLL